MFKYFIPKILEQMSTTELFLLTGETRSTPVPPRERLFTPTGKAKKRKLGFRKVLNRKKKGKRFRGRNMKMIGKER